MTARKMSSLSFFVDEIRRRGYEFRNSRIGIAPGAYAPGVFFWGKAERCSGSSALKTKFCLPQSGHWHE